MHSTREGSRRRAAAEHARHDVVLLVIVRLVLILVTDDTEVIAAHLAHTQEQCCRAVLQTTSVLRPRTLHAKSRRCKAISRSNFTASGHCGVPSHSSKAEAKVECCPSKSSSCLHGLNISKRCRQ